MQPKLQSPPRHLLRHQNRRQGRPSPPSKLRNPHPLQRCLTSLASLTSPMTLLGHPTNVARWLTRERRLPRGRRRRPVTLSGSRSRHEPSRPPRSLGSSERFPRVQLWRKWRTERLRSLVEMKAMSLCRRRRLLRGLEPQVHGSRELRGELSELNES